MPKKQDATQQAAQMVREVTGMNAPRAEDGFGDPETRRKFIEARDKELERQRQRARKK